MQRLKFLIPVLIGLGCQGGGGFSDIAKVKQAARELRRIRNAIEEYKLDRNSYPCNGSDLKVKLAPYLSKLSYSEGREVAKQTAILMGAENNLAQIRSALSGCARIKEEKIETVFAHVQEVINLYEKELKGKPQQATSILPDIQKMYTLINDLRLQELKSLKQDSLLLLGTQIIGTIDSILPKVKENEKEHLQNIRNTFEWYKVELIGKKPKKVVELYSPEGEITALKETSEDTSLVLNLQKLVNSYRELESASNYSDFLLTVQKDIEKVLALISLFEEKRKSISEAATIVQAQSTLHRMANALRDYRKENGRFPNQGVQIDSLIHPYFIETTMSGERIDRWPAVLEWFSGGANSIMYKTRDPEKEFVLEAKVNNKARTSIKCEVTVQNQWDKITEVFSYQPIYTTSDSTSNYFIKVRAKDTGQTWLTDRPPIAKKGV
ncbi:MAG: hypothetical protein QMD71_05130 [bacterium]|nr:hypothetical protein [bacterium]